MPSILRVRALSGEQAQAVRRLAQSRTEPARSVERAKIIWRSSQGELVPAIARELGLTEATVRLWVKRFVVFEHILAALVHGSGYERVASPGCSDRTIRRRLQSGRRRDSPSSSTPWPSRPTTG